MHTIQNNRPNSLLLAYLSGMLDSDWSNRIFFIYIIAVKVCNSIIK